MSNRMLNLLVVMLALAVATVSLTGCPKRPAENVGEIDDGVTGTTDSPDTGDTGQGEDRPTVDEDVNAWKLKVEDVFFDYDNYQLRSDSRMRLQENARYLKEHPDAGFLLEGHADERGTAEYNLALGQRRADAVRDYLVDLGVGVSRIRTVSYGEEKPFELGSTEAAWAQNRRVHFAID